jgi:hypothetical protein
MINRLRRFNTKLLVYVHGGQRVEEGMIERARFRSEQDALPHSAKKLFEQLAALIGQYARSQAGFGV